MTWTVATATALQVGVGALIIHISTAQYAEHARKLSMRMNIIPALIIVLRRITIHR